MLTQRSFYYLRHGETDWNRERRCQGHTDIPLNDTGLAQAHAAKNRFEGITVATICCSPLSRARQTADIVNTVLGRDIVVIDALKESGFGDCEGALTGPWHQDWQRGVTPNGAEPFMEFVDRAIAGVNQALDHSGPVLIVGHGGVYRSLVRFAGVNGFENLPNCLPIRHDPPDESGNGWTATELPESQ